MKKIRVFLIAVLMIFAVQICTVSVNCEVKAATTTAAVKKKTGLYKEGGLYYYYAGGKKIKSQWKTVNGKRYYFGSKYHAVRYHNRINGKSYVLDTSGRLLTGKTSRIVKVGNYSYYVNKYGNPATSSWLYLGDKNLYYADYWAVFTRAVLMRELHLTARGRL